MGWLKVTLALSLFPLGALACLQVPPTVEHDPKLSFTEANGYKFHTEVYGAFNAPPVIVIHGGPGGDFTYLQALKALADDYRVIFYDQRGSGLSPRVEAKWQTVETHLADLDALVDSFRRGGKVRLIGHSWGGMLAAGYLGRHPGKVSHAVIAEPGMLTKDAAREFAARIKSTQTLGDMASLGWYLLQTPLVKTRDGGERFDYVMTRILDRGKSGAPYQCEGEALPRGSFRRGGYEAFSSMLKPVMDNPGTFAPGLTWGLKDFPGGVMLIGSECSAIGYEYQVRFHAPYFPPQTILVKADRMGHNMFTLQPEWSARVIRDFFAFASPGR